MRNLVTVIFLQALHLSVMLSNAQVSDGASIAALIQEAVTAVRTEERVLHSRHMTGIDKIVANFTSTDPIIFSESPLDVRNIEFQSRIINWISRIIRNRNLNVTLAEALASPEAAAQNISCPFVPETNCSISRYRSIDGSCNNLQNPLIGAGFTPFIRDANPVYQTAPNGQDDLPRITSVSGAPLPGARLVSTIVHNSNGSASPGTDLSFIFSIWGQFLAHDVTDRAPGKGHHLTVLDCCNQVIPTPSAKCFNIDVPPIDYFRGFGRSCLSFPRSTEVTDLGCEIGRREQLNQASSFIDGSSVYGGTDVKTRFLRAFTGGELSMSEPNHLPYRSHPNPLGAKRGFCTMQSGDDRVTVFIGLIGMETVWFREHNRIARRLAIVNPLWDEETLYQETRRIIIAMIQHITYQEWLPLVVGPAIAARFGLSLEPTAYFTGYDPNINPSTYNGVATAAFRFGHSLMREQFNLFDKGYRQTTSPAIDLKDVFFKSNVYLLNEQVFMRGTLVDVSQKVDRQVSSRLLNNLYETRPGNGYDLPAFNIQRGRDHGLSSYNSWRRYFGLSPASEFSTNSTSGFADIPTDTVALLALAYRQPDDVDLWTGGVSEEPLPSAAVGPLFANMLGRQFGNYRRGDRFWYETASQPQAFTPAQLTEIRRVSFARVLCSNLDLDTIQPRAFQLDRAPGNTRVNCGTLVDIDFSRWR